MKKKITIVVLILCAAVLAVGMFYVGRKTAPAQASTAEENRALLTAFDYGDAVTYCIGHKSPDADTVMSAIAMSNLLSELGIASEPRISGEPNNETKYLLDWFSLPTPEILTDAAGQQLWLVDHSISLQAIDNMDDARIVGITDHHGIGDVETSELITVNTAMTGSTCTLVWRLYRDYGVTLSREMAGALLSGLLSDTEDMTKKVTALDEAAYADLLTVAGVAEPDALSAGRAAACLDYTGMTDGEIFLHDYKQYETAGHIYGIGSIDVATPEELPAMAEKMQAVIDSSISDSEEEFLLYLIGNAQDEQHYVGIAGKDGTFATTLLTEALGTYGNVAGSQMTTQTELSRKSTVVPAVDKYLNSLE